MCEGCVDICPWKCIHMVSPDAIQEADGTEQPGADPSDNVAVHHRRRHLHTVRAVCRPLPDRRDHPRQGRPVDRRRRHARPHQQPWLRLWHAFLIADPDRLIQTD